MGNLESLQFILPEIILTITIGLLLLSDLVIAPGSKRLTGMLALTGVVAAGIALWKGTWGAHVPDAFMGMVFVDIFGAYFKGIALAATLGAVWIGWRSKDVSPLHHGEFHVLLLATCLGLFFMSTARDIVMVYLAVELVSQTSYILAGFVSHNPRSAEGSLKYVIYGGVASGVMIFGLSLLYGLTGTTDLVAIGQVLSSGTSPTLAGPIDPAGVFLSVVLILAGVGFKISAVPFHMWTPDVYEGAPTPVTAFLSIGPKAAGFALLIRFVAGAISEPVADAAEKTWSSVLELNWPLLLGIISVLTMTLGNLSAIWQKNVKRLLAYSSIAHAGYLLMGVACATATGFSAVMFYFSVYLLMNLGAFLVVIVVASRSGKEDLKEYSGIGWTNPFLAGMMTIFLFSLIGLPPTAGFLGKYELFAALVRTGEGGYYLLALAGLINSVISLYYYVYIAKVMWLQKASEEEAIPIGLGQRYILAGLGLLVLFPYFYWEPIRQLAQQAMERF